MARFTRDQFNEIMRRPGYGTLEKAIDVGDGLRQSTPMLNLPEASVLWDEYQKTGSVHRVASAHDTCGETVRKRLLDAGYKLNGSAWSKDERTALGNYYHTTPDADFSLEKIAARLNRTFASIAIKASRWGYTKGQRAKSDSAKLALSISQKKRCAVNPASVFDISSHMVGKPSGFKGKHHTAEFKENASLRSKAWIKANGHRRGMLGKKHTEETKATIGAFHTGKPVPREQVERMMRTKASKGNLNPYKPHGSWKAGWVEVGYQRFYSRSRWEANYGRYLEWLKSQGQVHSWEHEPETFWFPNIKRGCVSYLPDFKVVWCNLTIEYHEVKGWMDARSITKIARMAKYHPLVKLKVIDSKSYKALAKSVCRIVPNWE